jgi:hypothetical protein
LLEDQVECWLLNAAHLHNVPGRKTGRLRAKLPSLRAALAGHIRTEHHRLLVAQILATSTTWTRRSRCCLRGSSR